MKIFVGPLRCLEKIENGEREVYSYKWYTAIGITLIFMLAYSIAMAIPQIPVIFNTNGSLGLQILAIIFEIGLIIGVVNAVNAIFFKKTYLEPIKKTKGRDYLFVFLATIALMSILNATIYPFYNLIPEDPVITETWEILSNSMIYLLFTTSIAAPIIEEIFFRGVIFRGLLKNYSPKTAIIVSAIIFGVIHGNIHQFITASILGMFLAYVYYKTDSIYLAIFIHFINNSLANFLIWGSSIQSQLIISTIYLAIAAIIIIFVRKKYTLPTAPKHAFSEEVPLECEIDLR